MQKLDDTQETAPRLSKTPSSGEGTTAHEAPNGELAEVRMALPAARVLATA